MPSKPLLQIGIAALAQLSALTAGCSRGRPKMAAAATGEDVFARHCAMCHADTSLAPGTMALAQRTEGSDRVLEQRKGGVPEEYVKQVVRAGMNRMPPLTRMDVSDRDLDAVASYLAGQRGK